MPEDIAREIRESFVALDARYVAVRSSATAEDSASAAWAGQLDSYLNTTEETLLTNVQRCWASLFTPRAIFYRFEKELHKQKISVAVVVQRMVESEVSGIAFSVHPVTEDRNQLIIEAGYGLGEAIVSGAITPDSYVVEKNPRRIVDINVNTQTRALYRAATGGNEWRDIPEPKASSQVLTEPQILELAELIIQIENHYGFPCDIEWAFERGVFYIVQSRPITTLSTKATATSRVLVNHFSREKSLYYFDLWNQCDRDGPKHFFGKGLDTVLFIVMPKGKKGSVWYDPDEMNEIKRLAALGLANPDLLNTIVSGLKEAWAFLKPYALSRDIESLDELKTYQKYLLQYWSTMNSGVWEALAEPNMPESATQAFVEVREQTEKYSERWSLLPTEFFARQYPVYTDIAHVVTFDEIVALAEGTQTAESLAEIQRRINGCFMLNSVVYSNLAELDAKLAEWHLVREMGAEAGAGEIRGTVAYKGIVRGLARIVDGKADLSNVQEGDILVTQMTNPTYVPVMKRSGAIVTDEGGALCHAAIASRELRIPCIIGTKVATQVLKDGDLVEVDADNGVVRIIERAGHTAGLPTPPDIQDYDLTFESKGTVFLFEDLVDECYNDAGTFSYAVEGAKKSVFNKSLPRADATARARHERR
jgi:phosphoenolpyruvate synthase/pyruvate phosphate dikinase